MHDTQHTAPKCDTLTLRGCQKGFRAYDKQEDWIKAGIVNRGRGVDKAIRPPAPRGAL